MKTPFSKPPISYAQQAERLRNRGMVISDQAMAEFYLQHLNYYRLAAYWLPFESDHATHSFKGGTQFEDVLNLYVFDRELRLLALDAIERVEVSVRAQWAYQIAHKHGPHAYLDASLALNQRRLMEYRQKLEHEVERSNEVFIRHLRAKYAELLPPIWAVCEVMSLGLLSCWYANLRPMATRRAISAVYGMDEVVLQSWLHHLCYVRNICAHHGRLWNRDFTITPRMPRSKPAGLAAQMQAGSRKLYNSLVILLYFLDVIAPRHHFRERVKVLIADHAIQVQAMEFPAGWENMRIWA